MTSNPSISEMLRYLRRPYFPAGRQPMNEAALRHLTQLLFLSLAMMIIVSGLVGAVVTSALGEQPENANSEAAMNAPGQLLIYGVLLAPVIEEIIFRSWLGGRLACLIGFPALIALAVLVFAVSAEVSPLAVFAISGGLGALVLGVARQAGNLSETDGRAARWVLFPVAFYGGTALFALTHLFNFEGGLSSPVLLIAVLPQFLVGAVLGYVRMRFGLVPAIVFHALYNLVLIGLAVLAFSLAGPQPTALIAA